MNAPQEAVAVDAVQVDIVSGDPDSGHLEPESEEKTMAVLVAMVNGGGGDSHSAAFNAAVDAHAVESQPVAPQVVDADFREMTDDVSNGNKVNNAEMKLNENGNGNGNEKEDEVVDLLDLNTMEDGGKVMDVQVDIM